MEIDSQRLNIHKGLDSRPLTKDEKMELEHLLSEKRKREYLLKSSDDESLFHIYLIMKTSPISKRPKSTGSKKVAKVRK